jgi:hypothetical protein
VPNAERDRLYIRRPDVKADHNFGWSVAPDLATGTGYRAAAHRS